ncbi:MAG: hypothetical protein LBT31_03530 [Synergistaceae bacterium]|nr:hypothetical protein [Synergistaceae bacterium]
MAEKKLLLGYLTVEAKDNYFRGAALVTDGRGIPVDFRYTEPVRPTRLERILYGGALDIYLREEVILENLLSAIETKPVLWLVDDVELIRPVQKLAKLPALMLEPTQRSPLETSGKYESTAEEDVFIFQADNISAPMRMSLSEENVSKVGQIVETLTAAAEDMELMEPFSRIAKAFEAVADSES